MHRILRFSTALLLAGAGTVQAQARKPAAPRLDPRLEKFKTEAIAKIDERARLIQQIIDHVYSFGELGMQEFETTKYLTNLLQQNGFRVERGVAGMPTAFVATWGSGKPVIALGSDIDGIPQSSQNPGVGYFSAMVPGAPGHGEGHNSGMAVNIAAALVVKEIMARESIPGTLKIWPGVAEEQVAGKAHLVRAGVFKDVDVALFTHVGNNLGVSWGQSGSNAIVTALFKFRGQTAHSAGAPWRGKSALDAVMLMGQGWEYKREHLEPAQRSHYVIKDGGDQPNVVPQTASIWFYIRERDYDKVMANFEAAKRIARGAAMMTDTQLDTVMILGSAWSGHFNKAIAEATYNNIKRVGNPKWDANDQVLAKGIQRELNFPETGLIDVPGNLDGPVDMSRSLGGGSDDIGDVSWNVPTVTLRYPSNIPGLPGHNWSNGISMATPIAHKGAVVGAKVQAATLLDIVLSPTLVATAWEYFNNEQTKVTKYKSFLGPNDGPPIWLNEEIMAKYRPAMSKFYYDSTKYGSYLEQLGIKYPTVKAIAQ